MTDYLFVTSQAKLAEYYDTRTDLPIRKFVLIANLMKKATQQVEQVEQVEQQAEEAWLDSCLEELDDNAPSIAPNPSPSFDMGDDSSRKQVRPAVAILLWSS
ncbi:hypothetical protein BC940DRAFT_332889 [Gongronella butleri]|nr:hypothetical protein BC940DRAFT_332889 [Gongronella butleri]